MQHSPFLDCLNPNVVFLCVTHSETVYLLAQLMLFSLFLLLTTLFVFQSTHAVPASQ